MKKFLLLIILIGQSVLANEEAEVIYKELLAICIANPDFQASSVSLYNPETASETEKEFQEKADLFRAKVDMLYLLARRKTADQAEIKCIDSIQNTWQG